MATICRSVLMLLLCFATPCVLLLQAVTAGRSAQGPIGPVQGAEIHVTVQGNGAAGHNIVGGRCFSPFDYGWCCVTTKQCWISRSDCETYCPN